ncbi:RDHE2 dehydrogenase, partial [Cinclus mexicanus]|nr:RDHE2 dehydrogenase [Cinclus mexicanus]
MNFFLETLKFILLFVYYLLESLVFLVVPRRKKNVRGEIVLITGAGSGIGRLLAIKFAGLGATVVLWDINQQALNCAVRVARENGAGRVHSYVCDCSKRQDVYRVADQVKKEVGDVSILINNAGVVIGKRFLDSPDSLVDKTMEVNTMAHFWVMPVFSIHILRHPFNMFSMLILPFGNYCASKFAAIGFAESIDMEMRTLRKTGVKTTIVCPFVINTGMFDGVESKWPRILPILDPEYVAERIISAVRQNQEMLFIPRIIYVLYFLKSFLPVKATVLILDYFGILDIMSTFKGRPKKE